MAQYPETNHLVLDRVRKVYGQTVAVDDISLVVPEGELLTLLGPSGSGKTTTLLMIAGLVDPSSGRIMLGGKDLTTVPHFKRNIGVVFQNYALFPHMTVFQNIAFPLQMRRLKDSEIRARVHQALELVQLSGLEHRYPRELSGGQQQRVALARAIVFEPRILLMDEPLGALDRKLRQQMQLQIRRIHKELGITIVYVTHDQEEALTMSDRIAIFNHGRLVQIGKPEELYEQPASEFVADFLGECNFIRGTIVERNGSTAIIKLDENTVVRARNPNGHTNHVVILIRPERLDLAPAEILEHRGSNDPVIHNAVLGVVTDRLFLGHIRKYLIKVGNGLVLTTSQLNEPTCPRFDVGDTVAVTWRVNDCMTLPASSTS